MSATIAENRTSALDARPALTAMDRCDSAAVGYDESNHEIRKSCGSQAFQVATFPSGSELLFCNHHGNKYAANLIKAGASIRNESDRINVAPSVSANHV